MKPVLSVIIACLNAERTLGAQLEALASQECPVPWELLLCDNGSTDGSLVVAESFRRRIPGLRVVDAAAWPGAGPARNLGVRHARGEWVAFCDADDVVAGDWLAAICRALAQHPFVAGRFRGDRLNGARVLRSRPMPQRCALQVSDFGARLPHAGGGNMGIHRDAFLRLGGFDPAVRWLEDTDFSWRAQRDGIPLAFCPDVVVHVRLRRTFRSMYVQGWQYGVAHAVLEERYRRGPEPAAGAVVATDAAGVDRDGAGVARGPVPERVAPWEWLVDHLVGGRLWWRAGWVVGHRRQRRLQREAPAVRPPAPRRAPSGPTADHPPSRDHALGR